MSTNIAVVSKEFVPEFKSKYTLFQTKIDWVNDQQYYNEIVKYTHDNKCVGYIEVQNRKYHENFIDLLLSEQNLADTNISFIYSDYRLNNVPVLHKTTEYTNLPLFFVRLSSLVEFHNIQTMLKKSITRHIPIVLLYA